MEGVAAASVVCDRGRAERSRLGSPSRKSLGSSAWEAIILRVNA